MVIHFEMRVIGGTVGENSLIEYLQMAFLSLTVILFCIDSVKVPRQRGFAMLLAGFFVVLLIRELDAFLDQIAHGFWIWPAIAISVLAIRYAVIEQKTSAQPLVDFTHHGSFGLMLAGIVALLVFSRLFGMGDLWEAVMQENYLRVVKNLVEEGTELFAYSLILASAAWYSFALLTAEKAERLLRH